MIAKMSVSQTYRVKKLKTWKWRLIYIRKDIKMLRKPTLENVYNAKTFLNDFR